jgi:predicted Holliday junction resolvase-like endonuclease
MDELSPEATVLLKEKRMELRERAKALKERERDIPKRSEVQSEATNIGVVLEQIAPTMKTFPFSCNDCRSLFKPIDYVVFDGMCKKNEVDKIVFMDIKTGRAHLTQSESAVKHVIKKKNVLWDTYDSEAIK